MHAVRIIAGLTWIELRRLVRGWRWRAFAAMVLALCYVMDRGDGFGEGARVAFPGGPVGVFLFGLLFGVGAMVMGADIAGQPDRHRARLLLDARPIGGVAVPASRWMAVVGGLVPLALLTSAWPFLLHRPLPLAVPSLLATGLVLAPLVAAGAGAGLAGRRWVRSDAGGFLLGGLLLAPTLIYRLVVAEPNALFTEYSAGLGLLVPWPVALNDAAVCVAWGGALAMAAGLGMPGRNPRTLLSTLDPPTRPRLGGAARLAHTLREAARVRPATMAAGAVALGLVGFSAGPSGNAVYDVVLRPTLAAEDELRATLALPAENDGRLAAPRIVARRIVWAPDEEAPLTVELDLLAPTATPQAQAVVTFGRTLVWRDATVVAPAGARAAASEPLAATSGLPMRVLTFAPPLDEATTTTLVVSLAPDQRGHGRAWARTRHPVYATFRDLPLWYGEGVLIDTRRSTFAVGRSLAPFRIELPGRGDQRWFCGSATEDKPADSPDRVILSQSASGVPEALFAAAMVEIARPPGPGMDFRFVVEERRRPLAEALLTAWGPRLDLVQRALGPPPSPIVFHETPGQVGAQPLSLASAQLDTLEALLPKYEDFDAPTAPVFDAAFSQHHRVVIEQMIAGSFLGFEEPRLLRDASIDYLHDVGLRRGMTREAMRDLRTDFLLVPWSFTRPRDRYPYDLTPADEEAFRGPMLDALRPVGAVPVPDRRRLAFHHMLRGALGDRGYALMWQQLRADGRGHRLTIEDLRAAAERQAGHSLEGFFRQWLIDGAIPRLRLREANVVLVENPATRQLEYTTTVTAANEGDGTVDVPVVLATDADPVTINAEFGPGAQRTITFKTLDRPISVTLDPEGWLVQMPPFDPRTKRPEHPQLLLKTVREMETGK